MMSTQRSLAVVTGASSGIGLEFAKLLAADGYDLILAARDRDRLEQLGREVTQQFGVEVRIVAVDLSKSANVDRLVGEAGGRSVDVLVNSAGFGATGSFEQLDWELEQALIQLNITALTKLCHELLPGMVKRGSGRILNVASTASFVPGPYMAVYYASKAYVLSLSQALSSELAGTGVSVTALCPGPTSSGFSRAAGANRSPFFARALPSAASVASFGYQAMKQGRVVAIHGWQNRLLARIVSILPRQRIANYIKKQQKSQQ